MVGARRAKGDEGEDALVGEVSRAQPLTLYAGQQAGVDRFASLGPAPRLLLAYGTGCGKTPTSIRAIKAHCPNPNPRVLVVCPAMVRRHWCREFQKWAGLEALPIEMGRQRATGPKAARQLRDKAYRARIQVVSYDLLREVDLKGWDYIVFDEVHHLGNSTSKQSRTARSFAQSNPQAGILGLSATLIPTNVAQIWHPLYLMFGDGWGKPSRTGGLSWKFAERFLGIEQTEYGCVPGNGSPEQREELSHFVSNRAHRLTRSDIAGELPPLDVKMLDVPGHNVDVVDAAIEWQDSQAEDIHKTVLLTYHRSAAQALAERLRMRGLSQCEIHHIDGSMSTAKRDEVLSACEAASSVILVATTESIREGVRLMWAERVLLAEWRQSPAQVIQILGRFQSVGDPRKPQVDVLYDESLVSMAMTLVSRVNALNEVLKAGETETLIASTFKPRELSEDRILQLSLDMFNDVDVSERRKQFCEEEEGVDE